MLTCVERLDRRIQLFTGHRVDRVCGSLLHFVHESTVAGEDDPTWSSAVDPNTHWRKTRRNMAVQQHPMFG